MEFIPFGRHLNYSISLKKIKLLKKSDEKLNEIYNSESLPGISEKKTFFLIDHQFLTKWKNQIQFDKIIKKKSLTNEEFCKYMSHIEKEIQLDNKNIYKKSEGFEGSYKIDCFCRDLYIILDKELIELFRGEKDYFFNGATEGYIINGNKIFLEIENNIFIIFFKNKNFNEISQFEFILESENKFRLFIDFISKEDINNWINNYYQEIKYYITLNINNNLVKLTLINRNNDIKDFKKKWENKEILIKDSKSGKTVQFPKININRREEVHFVIGGNPELDQTGEMNPFIQHAINPSSNSQFDSILAQPIINNNNNPLTNKHIFPYKLPHMTILKINEKEYNINNCLSSIILCLSNIKELSDYFLMEHHFPNNLNNILNNDDIIFFEVYKELIKNLIIDKGNNNIYTDNNFSELLIKKIIKQKEKNNYQNEIINPKKTFLWIMNFFRSSMKSINQISKLSNINPFININLNNNSNEENIFNENFFFKIKIENECKKCHQNIIKFIYPLFLNFNLPLIYQDSWGMVRKNNKIVIFDGFDIKNYDVPEEKCEKCKEIFNQKKIFYLLPKYIIIFIHFYDKINKHSYIEEYDFDLKFKFPYNCEYISPEENNFKEYFLCCAVFYKKIKKGEREEVIYNTKCRRQKEQLFYIYSEDGVYVENEEKSRENFSSDRERKEGCIPCLLIYLRDDG